MKKIKFIIFILLGVVLTNSCADKDLTLEDPNNLPFDPNSLTGIFKSEADVRLAVTSTYNNTRTYALYGRLIPYMMDNMAQENSSNPQQEVDKITYKNFSFTASNAQIADYWTSCYIGINRCNFVIANELSIYDIKEASFTKSRRDRYLAEAKYMRAFYYFLLVNRFGDLPLVTKVPIKITDIPLGRAAKKDIIDLIIKDLQFAATNLLDKNQELKSRANSGAANALLGKVLLYQKDYAGALIAFNKVTGYSLEADYYDNFKEETEFGPESIFEINFDEKLGAANKWDSATSGDGQNFVTFRGQDYGCLNWHNVDPSDNLLDEFEPNDKRYAGSFYSYGDKIVNGTDEIKKERPVVLNGKPQFNPDGSPTIIDDLLGKRAAWKKYQNYYKQVSEKEQSSINFKIIRYADVLLMKAECENEVGSQATAVGYINQVRARAGLSTISAGSKDDVFKAIVHERKVELAGEQVRFDDILRWGNSATELAGSNFQSRNKLWPIPSKEFSTNNSLKPSDQNPGY
jgi:starch-binding outer membrane protein, SusD/RagB family